MNFINMLVSGVEQFLNFFTQLPDTISSFLGDYIPPEIVTTLLIIISLCPFISRPSML